MAAAAFVKLHYAAGPEAPRNNLAVLPFDNISGDTHDEYFADGMTEELISSLATIRELKWAWTHEQRPRFTDGKPDWAEWGSVVRELHARQAAITNADMDGLKFPAKLFARGFAARNEAEFRPVLSGGAAAGR